MDATAAADAALRYDLGVSFQHPYGFGRATPHAGIATAAAILCNCLNRKHVTRLLTLFIKGDQTVSPFQG